jgi:D-glycero-alpha-D-manno-heptose-7-phosphate kinase
MLMVRSPLRITLGGGGTDLESYGKQYGGFCISATINKYSYVGINHSFYDGFILKYSNIENVKKVSEISHPIFREALRWIKLSTPQIEIFSIGDVPSNGAGLGNSGSFTTALLYALHSYKNTPISQEKTAEIACDINIGILKKIQGKQDEYASALGGINCLTFNKDVSVEHEALKISHDTMIDLEENLMLFYTGINHSTEEILSYQDKNSNEEDMISNLHEVKQVGYDAKLFLEHENTKAFADLLNIQWQLKEDRMPTKNSFLEELHYGSLEHGAIGSKLIGSGMGGFIMCYTENKNKLRQYMKSIGLEELRFSFDFEGCKRMV